MKYPFVDRHKELTFLEAKYSSGSSELIIIYGRRRAGKTELIKQSLIRNDRKSLYFLGEIQKEGQLAALYSRVAGLTLDDDFLKNNPLNSWHSLFDYLTKLIEKGDMVLIFDELPYIYRGTPGFISILQFYWDEKWKDMNLKLILCGSSVSMMQKIALSYESPIYGRRTGQIHLQPLGYLDFRLLFKDWDEEDIVAAYSLLGGIPRYAEEFDSRQSLSDNIMRALLDKDAFLYKEAKFLLMEELKDFSNYFSIIKAVAFGKNSFNEISNFSGVSTSKLYAYISRLVELSILRRDIPVTLSKEKSTRSGSYVLSDYFFRFWFRHIYPNSSLIEIGKPEIVHDIILEDLNNYIGRIFEDISSEILQKISMEGGLPLLTKWGKWWHRGEEIDIVALNDDTGDIMFCECKWKNRNVDRATIVELMRRSELVEWKNKTRVNHYVVVSKTGFTEGAKTFALENRVHMFTLVELVDRVR
ncbi:MAG: ATP-binding protein, partial [Alphaproteobacteria bacterium]|nr:ATP-binding protein [Alphaproteobacteria bacterium]